jgi:hypothetical protein
MLRQMHVRALCLTALLLLIGIVGTAPVIAADESQQIFGLSVNSGRPGLLVEVQQVDPCPETGGSQFIRVTFTDAAGRSTTSSYPLMSDPDGTWPFAGLFNIPAKEISDGGPFIPTTEAAQGVGTFNVICIDMLEGSITLEYAQQSFTVTGPSPQFTTSPHLARPGDVVHFQSEDVCPVASADVHLTISDYFGMTYSPEVNPNDGSWSIDVTIPVSVWDSMQGQHVPILLMTYVVKVTCEWTNDSMIDSNYGMQALEVRTAPVRYVALGDSFSSGEGSFDYIDPNDPCHKSETAYPYLIASEFDYGEPNLASTEVRPGRLNASISQLLLNW